MSILVSDTQFNHPGSWIEGISAQDIISQYFEFSGFSEFF